MIAEKAADMIREKDTVQAIKEYFRHLYEVKHKKIMEDEDIHHDHSIEANEGTNTDSKKPWEESSSLFDVKYTVSFAFRQMKTVLKFWPVALVTENVKTAGK